MSQLNEILKDIRSQLALKQDIVPVVSETTRNYVYNPRAVSGAGSWVPAGGTLTYESNQRVWGHGTTTNAVLDMGTNTNGGFYVNVPLITDGARERYSAGDLVPLGIELMVIGASPTTTLTVEPYWWAANHGSAALLSGTVDGATIPHGRVFSVEGNCVWPSQAVEDAANTSRGFWINVKLTNAAGVKVKATNAYFGSPVFFDGSVPSKTSIPGYRYAWSGSANGSVSVRTLVTPGSGETESPYPTPSLGDVALIGDSLIEGLAYTSSHAKTVGRLLLAKGAAPHRYWLPASGHEGMLFAASSQSWASAQPAYNGVPYSFFLPAGQSVEWPLESPARVVVWVRRDNGTAVHTLPVAVTSASGQSGTLSGAQQDPSGLGIERVAIDSPGGWVRVTAPTDKIQILGVQVFVTTGTGGSGVYAFGQSGMASDYFAQQTHQWRTLANLVVRLGVDHVITDVMVNDAIAGRSTAEYVSNINTAIDQLAQAGISRVSGLAMPNLGGRDLSAYRAALQNSELSDVWDVSSLGRPGEVGADGTHLSETGNAALAEIVRDALSMGSISITDAEISAALGG